MRSSPVARSHSSHGREGGELTPGPTPAVGGSSPISCHTCARREPGHLTLTGKITHRSPGPPLSPRISTARLWATPPPSHLSKLSSDQRLCGSCVDSRPERGPVR